MSQSDITILLAGILSGFVSEIGAAGSLFSLPMLISLGLPPIVANGTNRIAVLSLYTSAYGYYAYKETQILHSWMVIRLFLPIALGTILGAFTANVVTNAFTHWAVVVFSILVIIFNTNTQIRDDLQITTTKVSLRLIDFLALMFVGVYAGLIQSGMTHLFFYVLANVVLIDYASAKYLKFYFSMLVTPIALLIFMIYSNIDYRVGVLLLIGGAIGGWIGSIEMRKWSITQNRNHVRLAVLVSIVYLIIFIFSWLPKSMKFI